MIEFVFRPIDRWPQEPTPASRQKRASFRAPYTKTLALLRYELERLGAKRVYLQADVTERDIRIDGQLRADSRPRTSRVIVAAETKHGPISLPCDTFSDWQDNLRAIALALEALRAVDRYGVTKRGEQYRGLKQIAAGNGPINAQEAAALLSEFALEWRTAADILRSQAVMEDAYRQAAMRLHPDVAGSDRRADWDRLQLAVAILRYHHEGSR